MLPSHLEGRGASTATVDTLISIVSSQLLVLKFVRLHYLSSPAPPNVPSVRQGQAMQSTDQKKASAARVPHSPHREVEPKEDKNHGASEAIRQLNCRKEAPQLWPA